MTRKDLAENVLRVLRQIDKLTLPEQLDVILASNTFIEIEIRRALQSPPPPVATPTMAEMREEIRKKAAEAVN